LTEDMVNHPKHYERLNPEPIDVMVAWFGSNCLAPQIIKYIARAGYKDDIVQDLKKARFYLDRWIAEEEKKQAPKRLEVNAKPSRYFSEITLPGGILQRKYREDGVVYVEQKSPGGEWGIVGTYNPEEE